MTEEERIFRGELFASEEPELVEVEEGHFCRCWGVLEDKA